MEHLFSVCGVDARFKKNFKKRGGFTLTICLSLFVRPAINPRAPAGRMMDKGTRPFHSFPPATFFLGLS
jgi:hypothetical protein